MSNEAKVKITLVKSLNGRHDKHIATAHSLGLRKIDDSTIQPDSAATQGKISQISYLVKVENV
ncbi:MAG: 50S ribosomal protein L30 [Clostridiales bacterium]|nr:MAG: 50S ribosomal protein L30 [Clostridiales bacterium]